MRYKKAPSTFLVETINYNHGSDKDMFAKESIVIAANENLIGIKKEQAENNLDEAETINLLTTQILPMSDKIKMQK